VAEPDFEHEKPVQEKFIAIEKMLTIIGGSVYQARKMPAPKTFYRPE